MDQMPVYVVIIGSLYAATISQYYCSTSKGSKLLIYKRLEVLDNQQSSHERRQTRNKKTYNHEASPLRSLCLGRRKNLTWEGFRSSSLPDFGEQVYTSSGYLGQDRQETEICARMSVITDKRKERES